MPCYACSKYIPISWITRHGHIVKIVFHKKAVYMLVLREETQADGAYIKIRIHIHYWVVTHLFYVLYAELP